MCVNSGISYFSFITIVFFLQHPCSQGLSIQGTGEGQTLRTRLLSLQLPESSRAELMDLH